MGGRLSRSIPAVPERLSPGSYFLVLMGPLLVGAGLTVQLMLTGVLLAKPPRVDTSRLTDFGRFYFTPDRDVPLYLSAVVFFVLLATALVLIWNRRLTSTRLPAPPVLRWLSAGQALAAGGGTVLYVALFLKAREYLIDGDSIPARYFVVFAGIALGLITAVLFAWLLAGRGRADHPDAEAGDGIVADRPAGPGYSLLDLAVPALIVGSVYVTAWRQVAGDIFVQEGFFHWDFFAMGPALAFRHGRALGSEIFSMYGLGWPAFFGTLFRWIPPSYGVVIQVASIYACVYMCGVYLLLRLLTRRAVVAALGAGLVLAQFYVALEEQVVIWRFPSLSVLRWPLDVWCFIALVLHHRSGKRAWAVVAGVTVGLAIFFVVDTGLYLAAAVAFYWLAVLTTAQKKQQLLADAAWSIAASFAALAAGLLFASRGGLFQAAFWRGWLESLLEYGTGFAQVPLSIGPEGLEIAVFVVIFSAYLAMFGYVLARLVHRRAGYLEVFNGFLALYGLLILLHFVGRSGESVYRVWMPLGLIATNVAGAMANYARPVARRIWGEERRSRVALRASGAGLALASLTALVLLPTGSLLEGFLAYPSPISSLMREEVTLQRCLLSEPKDICGDQPTLVVPAPEVQAIVERLRSFKEQGKTFAVIDESGAFFYMATDTDPFGRYSRIFNSLLSKEELDDFEQRLRRQPPDFILTRPEVTPPSPVYAVWHFNSWGANLPSDTLEQLRGVVADLYHLEATAGPFEFWALDPGTA
ncbi:MAG TPA: hypothetical protein VHL54_07455 [Actinomycetota bacterium]|nr:hypothetical protein [Actinomycetota bacterium]